MDSFDAVICRIALMLFPNPAKALTEMRRVVKPEEKVAVTVFSALEKNPYHGIVFAIVQRLGSIPPPAPGEPWIYALGLTALRFPVRYLLALGRSNMKGRERG